MREEVHLHRKAVGNLSLGFLSTYLLHASFFGGVQLILILNRGSRYTVDSSFLLYEKNVPYIHE